MSRGPGRLMVAILGDLRAANGPLTVGEIANGIFGSRTVTRSRLGRRRRIVVPAVDVSNLRRALRGLVERGDVVVVDGDALAMGARGPRGKRYAVSDRCTGNEGRPVPDVNFPSLLREPMGAPGLPANDVALAGPDATEVSPADVPANDLVPSPDNPYTTDEAPTTRRVRSNSGEFPNSSVRPTLMGGVAVRGALPVPARVFTWERGLLSTLLDDLFKDLAHHEANKVDDP